MGDDAHLEVDGDALGNILGRIATDTVEGNTTAQQQLDRLKQLRDRLPQASRARRELDSAIRGLDAPELPPANIPSTAPAAAPLRTLARDLRAVPLARQDTSREIDRLDQILRDFDQGKTGGLRLINAVRDLRNRRHESQEGKFEIDRAVERALAALEAMHAADRTSLHPKA